MKIMGTLIAASVLTLAAIPSAQAASITLGTPSYGGSGCPAGTASTTVSPDGKELSILFDRFVARQGRKGCALSIPVNVPQGFQVAIYTMDYRGYVGPRTVGNFTTDYFFAGQQSTARTKTFRGETNYFSRDSILTMQNVWSRCGDSLNMRVNVGMAATGPNDATVDSLDAAAGLIYHLQYRTCPV